MDPPGTHSPCAERRGRVNRPRLLLFPGGVQADIKGMKQFFAFALFGFLLTATAASFVRPIDNREQGGAPFHSSFSPAREKNR
jgi:hypothetical protein